MKIDLSGKTVLVTGGGRGIGAAISRRFGEAGAKVLVHYGAGRAPAEAIASEIGGTILKADLGDAEAVRRLWDDALAQTGRVDVLVNNAGIALGSPVESDTWLADWERTQAVNVTAPALLCRSALAHFKATGGGRIVNITSRAAHRGDTPDYMAYAASKAALSALTKSIARGWGRKGVTAFNVAPGFTRTEMAQDFIDQYGEAYATGDLALPRMTEPDDVAAIVVFLASGLADHATGQTIDVNAASYIR